MKRKSNQISLTKKGNVVVLKQIVPDQELTAKDILHEVRQVKASIQKLKDQIKNGEDQIKNLQEVLVENEKRAQDVLKFEDWALEVQKSKVKAIVDEVKDEVEKKVRDAYKNDESLTDEQNKRQMFRQYQHQIGTHPRVAEELDQDVVSNDIFQSSEVIGNPFV